MPTYFFGTGIEEVWIRYRVRKVGSNDVSSQTLWRFVSHLDSVLKDSYGEVLARVAC